MRLTVRGRHVELTEEIREHAEAKLAPIGAQLPDEVEIELELSEETRARHVAEAIVYAKGTTLRAHESAGSLEAAIDVVAANLERQVIRYREKRRVEPRRRAPHHGE
jgi:putative sigma-54 modulation protein